VGALDPPQAAAYLPQLLLIGGQRRPLPPLVVHLDHHQAAVVVDAQQGLDEAAGAQRVLDDDRQLPDVHRQLLRRRQLVAHRGGRLAAVPVGI
jgi:hypothetical protein